MFEVKKVIFIIFVLITQEYHSESLKQFQSILVNVGNLQSAQKEKGFLNLTLKGSSYNGKDGVIIVEYNKAIFIYSDSSLAYYLKYNPVNGAILYNLKEEKWLRLEQTAILDSTKGEQIIKEFKTNVIEIK